MGHRHAQDAPLQATRPESTCLLHLQAHPAALKARRAVLCQRAGALADVAVGQETGFHQYLIAIADAEHGPAGRGERAQLLLEPGDEVNGKDTPRGQVVAVGEAPRDHQADIVIQPAPALQQIGEKHDLALAARVIDGEGRLLMAIDAGGIQHPNLWRNDLAPP